MHLSYVEFHITNVCDLSCNNCNKFSNFNFKGSQKWNDVSSIYAEWAKILIINKIGIVGGEPLTNTDLANWIIGLRQLWPNAEILVATNALKLSKSHHIIEVMKKHNVTLRVSIHSFELYEKIINDVNAILTEPVRREIEYPEFVIDAWQNTYNKIKADSWPNCNLPIDFESLPIEIQKECDETYSFSKNKFDNYVAWKALTDATGFKVNICWYTHFHNIALSYTSNKFVLNHSDPDKAIQVCDQKHCHSFKNGKLYKCGISHALPEFIKQFKISISEEDQKCIDQYKPAEVSWDVLKLEKFIDNLNNSEVISICSFCPETYDSASIGNVSKKKYVEK